MRHLEPLGVERKTPPVSLGVPLGWPLRSGGQGPEADALCTELQARGPRSYCCEGLDLGRLVFALHVRAPARSKLAGEAGSGGEEVEDQAVELRRALPHRVMS